MLNKGILNHQSVRITIPYSAHRYRMSILGQGKTGYRSPSIVDTNSFESFVFSVVVCGFVYADNPQHLFGCSPSFIHRSAISILSDKLGSPFLPNQEGSQSLSPSLQAASSVYRFLFPTHEIPWCRCIVGNRFGFWKSVFPICMFGISYPWVQHFHVDTMATGDFTSVSRFFGRLNQLLFELE